MCGRAQEDASLSLPPPLLYPSSPPADRRGDALHALASTSARILRALEAHLQARLVDGQLPPALAPKCAPINVRAFPSSLLCKTTNGAAEVLTRIQTDSHGVPSPPTPSGPGRRAYASCHTFI